MAYPISEVFGLSEEHQNRPHQPHHGIKPIPLQILAGGECKNR